MVEPSSSARPGTSLTPRERETLLLYAKGLVQKEVAQAMGRSLQTVKNYMANAYARLEVENAIEAFLVLGWLTAPEELSP